MLENIGTVMLIDDEEIDQKSYRRILNRTNSAEKIISFTYAEDALSFIKGNPNQKIDVVFLDINMPRMNGFEFLDAAIKDIGPEFARMVIVMLTTSMDPLDRKRAEENPLVRAFFNKPLTVAQINQTKELLEGLHDTDPA
jgi:CheY-like chemotaxis protein